jgi:hypothetical protein
MLAVGTVRNIDEQLRGTGLRMQDQTPARDRTPATLALLGLKLDAVTRC